MKFISPRRLFPLILLAMLAGLMLAGSGSAQQQATDPARSATGGATTLEDILARQAGQKVNDAFRREQLGDPGNATGLRNQLGPLGGVSDADVYRAYRFGSADITTQARNPVDAVVIQNSGIDWLNFRAGPMRTFAVYILSGMLALLVLFYVLRGKVMIDGTKSGKLIVRFSALERFGHWLAAGSFIVLAITGLASLFGRVALIPIFGKDAFSAYAIVGKWVHNNVAWAFILGLVWIFATWVLHNLPDRHDINWLLKGGGLFTKTSHPPAKKFNAGQKVIFWSVILLGGSIALSGVSMLFPFELALFAKSFAFLNIFGLDLPTSLLPHEEMQLTQIWHALVSLILIAIVIAHIYIGSVGMEGAYDAVGSGLVDKQWARQHHSVWLEEVEARESAAAPVSDATPAE